MKLIRICACLALATAILLPSCDNFTGTATDQTFLNEYHEAKGSERIGVNSLTATLSNTTNQKVTITFMANSNVDIESLTEALTIRNLSDAADNATPYVQGSEIAYTVEQVSGDSVTLNMDLTNATGRLEFHIDAATLTGRNGTIQLDLDGDEIRGEAGDDDYYAYRVVTGPAAVNTGVGRNPRSGMNITAGGFSRTGAATDTYTLTYNRTYGAATDTADYKALFDTSLRIERYNPADHSWGNVGYTSSYATGTGVFTATFTGAAEGAVYRARLIDRANLQTNAAFFGYRQRYEMNGKEVTYSETITGPTATEISGTPQQLSWADQDDAFGVSVIADAGGRNVAIKITLDLTIVGDQGMNKATILPANLHIVREASASFVEMPWTVESLSYQSTLTGTNPVDNVIVIKLNPSYRLEGSDFQLIVGPGLRTLGDATPGVGARYFGDPVEMLDFGQEFAGFVYLESDGSTL